MRVFQLQIPIGSLPINLILVGNRQQAGVVFVPVRDVGVVIEPLEAGKVAAIFFNYGFCLGDKSGLEEEFSYETIYEYKNIPLMLRWLQQQNLQEPADVVFHM